MSKKQVKGPAGKKNQDKTPRARQSKTEPSSTDILGKSEASRNQSKDSTSSAVATPSTDNKTLYSQVYQLSKSARKYVSKQLPLIVPAIFLMLLGFRPLPSSIPLLNIVEAHGVASPIIGAILAVVFLAAMFISFLPEPRGKNGDNTPKRSSRWRIRPLVIATGMSTASFVISSTLLVIVLIRPAWCPNSLCFFPQIPAYGPHDANLEVDFTAIQSPTYVLVNTPSTYSLGSKNLPKSDDQRSVGAIRIDERKLSSPYLIAFNVHNLRSAGFSMIIEQVALVVEELPSIPHPLNVWSQPPSVVYQSGNLFRVTYAGQDVHTVLPATYIPQPGGQMQLKPLETDSLLLQITPHLIVATALRFSLQITYHIANELRRYTFNPGYVFEVIFAKVSNWNTYHLQDGQLVKDK